MLKSRTSRREISAVDFGHRNSDGNQWRSIEESFGEADILRAEEAMRMTNFVQGAFRAIHSRNIKEDPMNKFLVVLIFYIGAGLVVALLEKFFPPPGHDGGWGVSSLAFILLLIAVVVWFVVSLVKGFTTDKSYLLVALIHLIVMVVVAKKIFGIF